MNQECGNCRKKLGLHRYVPKPQWKRRWNLKEPLCSECWNKFDTMHKESFTHGVES